MTVTTVENLIGATPTALAQMKALLADAPDAGIRLGVVGGGCAGLQYKMEGCDGPLEGDLIQEIEGVKFYIHPMAAPYLKDTQIDYVQSMMESGFKFINPNATSSCGCGTSFGV